MVSFSSFFHLKHSVKHPFIISCYKKTLKKKVGCLRTYEHKWSIVVMAWDICLHSVNQKKKRSMFKSICNDRAMREKKNETLFVNLLTSKLGIKKKEIYIESMKITFWKFDLNMSIRV